MASPLAERLRRHVRRARLFPKAGTAIVAVSGGADSVALLDLLHDLVPELGITLVVAHADHGIQSDSRTVGQSVSALAARYGLPFELGELHLGPNATETEARRARYAWLAEVRRRRTAAPGTPRWNCCRSLHFTSSTAGSVLLASRCVAMMRQSQSRSCVRPRGERVSWSAPCGRAGSSHSRKAARDDGFRWAPSGSRKRRSTGCA